MAIKVKKVICEYCGQEVSASNYSKHLRRHQNHPETFGKTRYHLDHDDLFCKFCGKECKNKKSLVQHEIRCKLNPNKINTVIKDFNAKGRTPWNKGLTKETSKSIQKAIDTYSKNKALGLHNMYNPMCDEKSRKKLSDTCLRKSKEGTWHTSLAKNMHINYKGIDLHGTWELKYAQYLDEKGISWERCKDRFTYTFDDKIRYYTPDFYLVGLDKYIEIKGYATKKDYAKWTQFPKDRTLEVLMKKDLILLGIDLN